jgi:hypothetical protein
MSYRKLGALCGAILLSLLSWQTDAAELTPTGEFQLVSKTRVSRTVYEYTYHAQVFNPGEDANAVVGTVSTSDPHAVIVDEVAEFGDVASGETATSIDTFAIRQDRQYPFDASALSWQFEYEEPVVTTLAVDAGLSNVIIPLGESVNIAYTVQFTTTVNTPQNITFDQSVSPEESGLNLTTDFPPGWTSSVSNSWVVNESITGLAVGAYEIMTNVQVAGTSIVATVLTQVFVVEQGQGNAQLASLGAEPGAIPLDTPTEVVFTVTLQGTGSEPNTVVLESLDDQGMLIAELGPLADGGLGADLVEGDLVYTFAQTLESANEGEFYFRARADYSGADSIYSETMGVGVTRFPTEIQNADLSLAIEIEGSDDILSNRILVMFEPGTTPDEIESIIANVGGTVVGTIWGLGIYQVEFNGTGNLDGVTAILGELTGHPAVALAEPVSVKQISAVVPTDPKFGQQWYQNQVRSDEAWTIGRGGPLIAVLDTGVDYNHTDLSGKVIKGKNYHAPWWNPFAWFDPMDDHGHGTHVAGIAAAKSNNGVGIAGVSWASNVLAVKVCDANGRCPDSAIAAGIKYAADKGAKVINLSLGGYTTNAAVESAVAYAHIHGSLVVAAAGNDGCSNKHYPAAYILATSVGATDPSDGRSVWIAGQPACTPNSGSNFGSWVEIGAPGTGILSTLPGNAYASWNGTSMATPIVSGAAAVVWALNPGFSPLDVHFRLVDTAKPLTGANLGAGRLDVFEATFNGSFEIGDLSGWTWEGTASSLAALGPITPQDRNGHKRRMGYVSTGPAADFATSKLVRSFEVQSGVASIPVSFDYNFVTEEYPEFVGTIYDDSLIISLRTPSGSVVQLATESVNTSTFIPVGGIDFPGGDTTVGMTGWKPISTTVNVTQGPGAYEIIIQDAGDDIYDSVLLIDNIRFR